MMKTSTVILVSAFAVALFSAHAWSQRTGEERRAGAPAAMAPERDRPADAEGMELIERMRIRRAAEAGTMPDRMEQVERMRNWLDTVDRYVRLANDPSATGVAAVITMNDLLRARGPEAAIEHFNRMLPDIKNPTVKRAVQLQLIDLYRHTRQQDRAMELLRDMIMTAPPLRPGIADRPIQGRELDRPGQPAERRVVPDQERPVRPEAGRLERPDRPQRPDRPETPAEPKRPDRPAER